MNLHPHQHRALVAFLRREGFGDLAAAQAAFAPVQLPDTDPPQYRASPATKRLGSTRFLSPEQYDRLPVKQRPTTYLLVSESELGEFPGGIPGFPNRVRIEWLEEAWREIHG